MIRNARFNDLINIAKLHTRSFEGHFLPKLGIKLLANYYKEFINDTNIFIVSLDANNNINGLLLGTPDSSFDRNQFIRKNKIMLSLRMLVLCLMFDKDTWARIKGGVSSLLKQKEDGTVDRKNRTSFKTITLLSICVSQDNKGKGISKALVEEFEDRLTKLGYEGYILTVHKSNYRATRFYEKNEMSIFYESNDEYKYIKQLI